MRRWYDYTGPEPYGLAIYASSWVGGGLRWMIIGCPGC